jgi:sugar lactone lactonase YvrE
VWIPNGQYLVFSDMANNKLKKLLPPGTFTDFLLPPAKTIFNGSYLDLQERQVSCECGSNGLQVAMITNGVVTSLVTSCGGLKFYSPNDLTVKSDGSIWFTDPGYDSGLPLPPPSGPSVPPGFQPGRQRHLRQLRNHQSFQRHQQQHADGEQSLLHRQLGHR